MTWLADKITRAEGEKCSQCGIDEYMIVRKQKSLIAGKKKVHGLSVHGSGYRPINTQVIAGRFIRSPQHEPLGMESLIRKTKGLA